MKRTQRSDESVRSFTAELRKLITFCDYSTDEVDERLKENLIINTYSTEIRKKLFTLPNETSLKDVIKTMEMLEQAVQETKQTGETASGRTPPRTARLQAVQCQGRRYSDISEDDYVSEYGECSIDFGSDELDEDSSDSDMLQKISSLLNQLAKLKVSICPSVIVAGI